MPTRLCLSPRCGNTAVYRGRCQPCSRDRERTTHPNKHVYNSARWRHTRRKQLSREPLCSVCGHLATDVDHVVPIEDGGAIWSASNLQSLCATHHGEKTRHEQQSPNEGVT